MDEATRQYLQEHTRIREGGTKRVLTQRERELVIQALWTLFEVAECEDIGSEKSSEIADLANEFMGDFV